MKAMVLLTVVLICGIAAASGDEFTQYLGKNVTVNACNVTVYQGLMIEDWPDSIIVKELCDPKLGNVTIRKSCIISIREGYECIT